MPILSALLLASLPRALPTAPPNAATLIVYRAYAEPILFAPRLVIDGEEFGALGQRRLLAFALVPGRHRIEAVWPPFSAQRDATLQIEVRAGQSAYVELRAAAGYLRRKGVSMLVQQDATAGAAAIHCCRPPK